MLVLRTHRQTGFTLIEILISSAIGVLILAGALQLYSTIVRSASMTLFDSRLDWELHTTLEMITSDLRRAGYWAGQPDTDPPVENPFSQDGNAASTGAIPGELPNSCITFSYDRDKDKLLGVGKKGVITDSRDRDNVEQYGYRLHDGAVESRTSGRILRCDSGRWQDVTSSTTIVTELSFARQDHQINLESPGKECKDTTHCQTKTYIEVQLTGFNKGRRESSQTVRGAILVRNDRLESMPE